MDINDPECPLLVELKNVSKPEYYHTIHTAYLCSRIALQLKLDDAVVKACAYYHKIGLLKGENNSGECRTDSCRKSDPVTCQGAVKAIFKPGRAACGS